MISNWPLTAPNEAPAIAAPPGVRGPHRVTKPWPGQWLAIANVRPAAYRTFSRLNPHTTAAKATIMLTTSMPICNPTSFHTNCPLVEAVINWPR